MKRTERWK